VIREKAAKPDKPSLTPPANASTTAAIKAKLVQDSGLAALRIDVDTTDGVVTLIGLRPFLRANRPRHGSGAQYDGVTKVISTLLVKPKT
jgi:osmotically-inducible protein OsmY